MLKLQPLLKSRIGLKRLYALPESKLRELMDILEVEYVNRQAAQAGYIETELV